MLKPKGVQMSVQKTRKARKDWLLSPQAGVQDVQKVQPLRSTQKGKGKASISKGPKFALGNLYEPLKMDKLTGKKIAKKVKSKSYKVDVFSKKQLNFIRYGTKQKRNPKLKKVTKIQLLDAEILELRKRNEMLLKIIEISNNEYK